MAHSLTHQNALPAVLRLLIAPFKAYGALLVRMAENDSRVKQVAYLRSLTDAELQERGIKRDDIVQHVYGFAMFA